MFKTWDIPRTQKSHLLVWDVPPRKCSFVLVSFFSIQAQQENRFPFSPKFELQISLWGHSAISIQNTAIRKFVKDFLRTQVIKVAASTLHRKVQSSMHIFLRFPLGPIQILEKVRRWQDLRLYKYKNRNLVITFRK